MVKSKKILLILLALILVMVIIPGSFAADVNDTSSVNPDSIINDSSTILTDDGNSDVYVSTEGNDDSGDGSETNPYASISKGIQQYNFTVNGNLIIKNGNYEFTDVVNIDRDINIVGESENGVILDGNGASSIFKISNKSTVLLKNLNFVNGYNSTYISYSQYNPGAIYVYSANSLTIENCVFDNNTQGAIGYNGYSGINLTVKDSTFKNNIINTSSASNGGAINYYGPGNLTIINTSFINNSAVTNSSYAQTYGGAIYVGGNAQNVTIDGCTFINNSAKRGGAFGEYHGGNTTIINSVFINNTADLGNCIYDAASTSKVYYLYLGNNTYTPEDNITYTEAVTIINLDKNTRLQSNMVSMTYGDDSNLTATLTDADGNPIANQNIIFNLKNYYNQTIVYNIVTNSEGQAILQLNNVRVGKYNVTVVYNGDGTYDPVNTTTTLDISSGVKYSIIFDSDYLKITEGDSVIVNGTVVDQYYVPSTYFNSNSGTVTWTLANGTKRSISNAFRVSGSKFTFDISKLGLPTQDEIIKVLFDASGYYSYYECNGTLNVNVSMFKPNVPSDIDIIYVAKNGNDRTGNGTEENPLLTVQTALYANKLLSGGKTIFVKEGVYNISIYNIFNDVNIIGEKNKTIFTQNGGSQGMLMIDQGTTVNLTNITFRNGYTTPTPYSLITARYAGTVVNIEGCEFYNNSGLKGGVLAVTSGAIVNINNSTFHNNSAILITSEGGVLWVYEGTVNITNSYFYNNSACDGGAIKIGYASNVYIENTTFFNNTAYNTTISYGGGGAINSNSNLDIYNCTFIENYADLNGGAIYVNSGKTTVVKSIFLNNRIAGVGDKQGSTFASDSRQTIDLTVNYSIIISNDTHSPISITTDYNENNTVNLEYNYWGTNSKILSTSNNNYINKVIIKGYLNETPASVNYLEDLTIKFVGYNSTDGEFTLEQSVHDYDLNLSTLIGNVDPSTITIKDNVANAKYYSNQTGNENITMTNDEGLRYVLSFEVLGEIIKQDTQLNGSNVEMYYLDGSQYIVKLTTTNGTPVSNSNITVVLNNQTYILVTDENGAATIPLDLIDGTYEVTSSFNGDRYYNAADSITNTIVIKPIDTNVVVTANNITRGEPASIIATINNTGFNGPVTFTINGTNYYANASNGYATINVYNLLIGTYDVYVNYDKWTGYLGNNSSTQFTVNHNRIVTLTVDDLVKYLNGTSKVTAKLVDSDNNPISNANIIFNIGNVEFTTLTNDEGIATFDAMLPIGTYDITTSFDGMNDSYETASVNSTLTVKSTVEANNLVKMYKNGTQYYALYLDNEGKPLVNTSVNITVCGKTYLKQTNDQGIAKLNINLLPREYTITTVNPITGEEKTTMISVISPIIENKNIVMYYKNGTKFSVRVLGNDGNVVAGAAVNFTVCGKTYTKISDSEGIASLNINLAPKTYTITTTYGDYKVSNKITVLPRITAQNLNMKYKDGSKYAVKVVDNHGNPLAGQRVKITVSKKSYYKTTDNNGMAYLNINLKPGKYSIVSEFGEHKVTSKITISK